MSAVVAIGVWERLSGYALAGVDVRAADDPESVRAAWDRIGPDVGLVILTPAARAALGDRLGEGRSLWTVTP